MGTETVQGAQAEPVVTEASIIDRIMEAHGHVAPPPDAFTVQTYIEKAQQQGVDIGEQSALRLLTGMVKAGTLKGRRLLYDGHQRWVFWE